MLRERSLPLQRLLFGADPALIAVAWVAAWFLRFEVLTPPQRKKLSYLLRSGELSI